MEPTFEKLLVKLADGGVAFVIVGGIAVTPRPSDAILRKFFA